MRCTIACAYRCRCRRPLSRPRPPRPMARALLGASSGATPQGGGAPSRQPFPQRHLHRAPAHPPSNTARARQAPNRPTPPLPAGALPSPPTAASRMPPPSATARVQRSPGLAQPQRLLDPTAGAASAHGVCTRSARGGCARRARVAPVARLRRAGGPTTTSLVRCAGGPRTGRIPRGRGRKPGRRR